MAAWIGEIAIVKKADVLLRINIGFSTVRGGGIIHLAVNPGREHRLWDRLGLDFYNRPSALVLPISHEVTLTQSSRQRHRDAAVPLVYLFPQYWKKGAAAISQNGMPGSACVASF
ncbi:hypothetical protein [Rhizobium sp. No.120]